MRGLLNVLVLALAVALVGFVWLRVAKTLTKAVPPAPVIGQPKAVAWGNHVFPNRAGLEAWLKQRGVAYSVWASRHPVGVALIDHRTIHVATRVPAVPKTAQRVAAAHKQPARAAPARATTLPAKPRHSATATAAGATTATAGVGSRRLVTDFLWVIASLFLALALIPARFVASYSRIRFQPEHRTVLAAAAVAMAIGILADGAL
jgi:hypothetical protein